MGTPEWIKRQLSKENLAKIRRAGRMADRVEPRATCAAYIARQSALQVDLRNGVRLCVPLKLLPELRNASPLQLRAVEVEGLGFGLHWEELDVDFSVPGLVVSIFGGPQWMAELGRIGGQQTSKAKAEAARRNGRKGGRPRRTPAGVRLRRR